MSTATDPCLHFIHAEISRCLIGRTAPRDCATGCAAYAADSASTLSLHEHERTRCEIWSRVMGYHRPVSSWNPGKQQEHADRVQFREQS